jgi:hypothetical protein
MRVRVHLLRELTAPLEGDFPSPAASSSRDEGAAITIAIQLFSIAI